MPRAVMTRALALVAAAALLMTLTGCLSVARSALQRRVTDTTAVGSSAPTGTPAEATTGSSEASDAPALGQEPFHVSTYRKKNAHPVVQVTTNRGSFTIRLNPEFAPNTVATFLELTASRFYDGTTFHRVEPGFVVQGGDPQTKDKSVDPQLYGTGNPGFRLKAEFNGLKHETGTVAMARSQDPDSAGSQFYITLAPQPTLDNQYTVFGKVKQGMDVVQQLRRGDVIESITILKP